MKIQTTIDALLNAFARRRREGHTTALFAGAANTPGITVIAADLNHAHNLETQHHGPTYLPLAQIDKLIGHRGPIAIDHHAIQTILAAANHEIDRITTETNKLTRQLAEARDQAHNADLRADRAKRERDAVAHDLDTIRADARALLFIETDHEREANHTDRNIAFSRRALVFLDKHRELMKPAPEQPAPSKPWHGKLHHDRSNHADWGWIRDEAGDLIMSIRTPNLTETELRQHRRDRTDPGQPVVEAILARLNRP